MRVDRLWLADFRNYERAEVDLAPGLTALLGANGEGKTNVVEALGWLATLQSFRGAPTDAMIRRGAAHAVVRAEGERDGRATLIEAQLVAVGRNRVLVNRQPLRRARDLLGVLRVTVFGPEDLELVKGGPGERRRLLDDTLVSLHPRMDATRTQLDRILRQRNTLLRQAAGRLTPEVATTLDVWDAKLTEVGGALAEARAKLLADLLPVAAATYDALARGPADVHATYAASWEDAGLAAALAAARRDDVRRGVSTVGPHRDEVELGIGGLPARSHASQGEQRSLALALRVAAHRLVTDRTGVPPLLLLDDVFSELDPDRSDALLASVPAGQTLVTSASGLPARARPDRVLQVASGAIGAASPASGSVTDDVG